MESAGVTLAQFPCLAACDWSASARFVGNGLRLFRCAACTTEWVRSEAWTPVQHDGTVPAAVAAEAARR